MVKGKLVASVKRKYPTPEKLLLSLTKQKEFKTRLQKVEVKWL